VPLARLKTSQLQCEMGFQYHNLLLTEKGFLSLYIVARVLSRAFLSPYM